MKVSFKHLQWWEPYSGFVSSKNKQLRMRWCDGWGNKDNGGNSEAASLGAAPFLKKALWVLRHLNDQGSAMQILRPQASLKSQLSVIWFLRVGTYAFKLMLASLLYLVLSILFSFECHGLKSHGPLHWVHQFQHIFQSCHSGGNMCFALPTELIHLISSPTLRLDL